jgi:ubiquinone biosynthesis protein UbiJ
MVIAFILPIIEKILNRYLQLDPESKPRLMALENKVIAQQFQPGDLKIYWIFNGKNIQLSDRHGGFVDVTIQGSPLDFLRFSSNLNDHTQLFASDIVTTGNLEVAQDFKALFANLEIDWEEQLSHVTGDVIAHQVGNVFRGLTAWAQQSRNSLRQDITEYVQEETRCLPPREELQDFFRDVDQVRDAAERLELRIQRLEKDTV